MEQTQKARGTKLFSLEDALRELADIREEVEESCAVSEDGGIGLEWRPENGIATMSVYGDNLVIYGTFFSNKREVNGICSRSDTALLEGFITTLRNHFQ